MCVGGSVRGWGGEVGVRVDMNEEVFVKIQKKNAGGGGRVGGQAGCKRRM